MVETEESVSLDNPAAGTYTVEVVGFDVPAGTTDYDYRDVFFSPALGSVNVPAAGRALFGEMAVVTDEGAVVGRGAITIGAVT